MTNELVKLSQELLATANEITDRTAGIIKAVGGDVKAKVGDTVVAANMVQRLPSADLRHPELVLDPETKIIGWEMQGIRWGNPPAISFPFPYQSFPFIIHPFQGGPYHA